MVDDTICDYGVWLRVEWKGYDKHTWEPEWKLEGNENIIGTVGKVSSSPPSPPHSKVVTAYPPVTAAPLNVHTAVGAQTSQPHSSLIRHLSQGMEGVRISPERGVHVGRQCQPRVLRKQRRIGLLARLPEVRGVPW